MSVASVLVFDPSRKAHRKKPTEEDVQDAKIIYYHPSGASPEEKRQQVGLVEGLISFTRMFRESEGSPAFRAVRTQQHLIVARECEPSIWMAMALLHSTTSGLDGADATDWDDDDVSDTVLLALLRNCHEVFTLLHGRIRSFCDRKSRLCDLFEDFIPAYIATIDCSDLTILHEMDGYHFGPVERGTYLAIQSFLSVLQRNFPVIRYAALLYDAYLVYSGLPPADMRLLYSYLVSYANGNVSNHKLNRRPFGRMPTAASQPGGGSSSFGRVQLLEGNEDGFIFGPSNVPTGSGASSMFVPPIALHNGSTGQLLAFLYQGIMLVMVLHGGLEGDSVDRRARLAFDPGEVPALHEAAVYSPGGLKDLLPSVHEQFTRIMSQEDSYRFVYFNAANHAVRKSNRATASGKEKCSSSLLPHESHVVQNMHAVFTDTDPECREILLKSSGSGWIGGKNTLDREFFVALDGSNLSFTKAQDEMQKFGTIHFANIFID
ncbi:unnamed protein product [Vitrella brassicaformis CCMP3155]|uniref:CCZ1/INTU/HSP4 first Longin domain-containing protein n=2 Tax=Vitrella brassicaformis TaxID=1169539 RepID=A0A0G4FZ51_VITBC|nr:unnamed protein product [Vitrella brassicaformis CCMP3155]|eukprot:CEM20359.1 unnamed protein product [Vitrella brassicaformis CCMP3155]